MPRISDTIVSWIVHGSTLSTSPITGWPLTSETPQSPRNAPARKTRYCSQIGRFKAQALTQRVDRLAARLVAEDELRRIARHDAHQHEHERQHREQRDAREREAAYDERGHGALFPPASSRADAALTS